MQSQHAMNCPQAINIGLGSACYETRKTIVEILEIPCYCSDFETSDFFSADKHEEWPPLKNFSEAK
jgi:hypothetical protein